jgi:hypothetical protein
LRVLAYVCADVHDEGDSALVYERGAVRLDNGPGRIADDVEAMAPRDATRLMKNGSQRPSHCHGVMFARIRMGRRRLAIE